MPDSSSQVEDLLAELASSGTVLRPEDSRIVRREARSETNWIAMIRLFDGTEIPCNVKDISKSGAKLGVPEVYDLPASFMLRILGRDFVLRVSLAWRRGNYAGIRIDRIAKLPVAAEEKPEVVTQAPDYHSIGHRRSRSF